MSPVLTTLAGACLTTANWQEAGVSTASFYLASLLMKPGYDFLATLPDLATYVGWHQHLILNASLPTINSDGLYVLRSDYDGSRSTYSTETILALIATLKPSIVILPKGIGQKYETVWQTLPDSIMPFFPVTELPDTKKSYGVYISYDEKKSSSIELLQQLAQHKEQACYISGHLSLSLMLDLVSNGAQFVESDRPASDGCLGSVYCKDGDISLQDTDFSLQFVTIDEDCHCPTCSQQLTRAYLHHLLQHTPLLCQRLLVQHNVYYCQDILRKK